MRCTDAASEGLNLQRLGTLVNLDLPWNPSRLEQRKGRIQRIGQTRSEVDIYNMRYANSVEDRVRQLLSQRLKRISRLFGQLPDTLEDVWVQVALGRVEQARQTIDAVPEQHPFALRYHEVSRVDGNRARACSMTLQDSGASLAGGRTERTVADRTCSVCASRMRTRVAPARRGGRRRGRTPAAGGARGDRKKMSAAFRSNLLPPNIPTEPRMPRLNP